jgi:predicted TPR repeat methyltransferase
LSGAAIAQFARHMVGVDLSSKMLDKARERNLYARLEQLDLLAMMQAEPASSYDVVFAADVFVYLGKLDDLVSQARRLLRPGGLFAFSVESLEALHQEADSPEGHDYHLNATGRYAHSSAYLAAMASRNRFDALSITSTQSRSTRASPCKATSRCGAARPCETFVGYECPPARATGLSISRSSIGRFRRPATMPSAIDSHHTRS